MKMQNSRIWIIALVFAVIFTLCASDIFAANYVVFVHGKGGDSSALSVTDSSRWHNSDSYGYASTTRSSATWARRFVNYDSRYSPLTSGTTRAQTKLTTAINNYCTGTNKCYIVCHSAGCYAVDYWLSIHSSVPGIVTVIAAASAAGGSPVADYGTTAALLSPLLALIGLGVAGEPNSMTLSLKQGTARGAFNHNVTGGKYIRHVAGYKSSLPASTLIGGSDDKLVNFAGACGYNKTGNMTHCADGSNPKYTNHILYLNTKGAVPYNSSNYGYNADHSAMQPVGRDALDRILGYL